MKSEQSLGIRVVVLDVILCVEVNETPNYTPSNSTFSQGLPIKIKNPKHGHENETHSTQSYISYSLL